MIKSLVNLVKTFIKWSLLLSLGIVVLGVLGHKTSKKPLSTKKEVAEVTPKKEVYKVTTGDEIEKARKEIKSKAKKLAKRNKWIKFCQTSKKWKKYPSCKKWRTALKKKPTPKKSVIHTITAEEKVNEAELDNIGMCMEAKIIANKRYLIDEDTFSTESQRYWGFRTYRNNDIEKDKILAFYKQTYTGENRFKHRGRWTISCRFVAKGVDGEFKLDEVMFNGKVLYKRK